MFAANYKLNNLIAIVDRNRLQICGDTEEVMSLESLVDKWMAFGWDVIETDGHDIDKVVAAFEEAKADRDSPVVIIFNTVKGKGVSFMENNPGFHGKACNATEYKQAVEELKKVI